MTEPDEARTPWVRLAVALMERDIPATGATEHESIAAALDEIDRLRSLLNEARRQNEALRAGK